MDKFVRGLTTNKRKAGDESSHTTMSTTKAKTRKYDETYLAFGFTSITVGEEERPQCVVCLKILASDSLKATKLKRHLETTHPEHKHKPVDFFLEKKRINCREQQIRFTQVASVPSNAQPASYRVAYRVAQCKKPHTIAEELILPAAIDMVSTMINEAAANKLKAIPLSNNTIARRIDDMSRDIEEQLNDMVRESCFALQMDEAPVLNKECFLITYVRFIDAGDLKEDLLFCKQITSRAMADELFKIIDTYLKEADLKWGDCVGICTDSAQAMAGKEEGCRRLSSASPPTRSGRTA